jgi:hypothetical protein
MESSLFTEYKLETTKITHYYDKYPYKMIVRGAGLHHCRQAKHVTDINAVFNTHYPRFMYLRPRSSETVRQIIGTENEKVVRVFWTWIIEARQKKLDVKISVSHNKVFVYYKDEHLIESLLNSFIGADFSKSSILLNFHKAEQIPHYERGVVYLLDPKYKFRVTTGTAKIGNKAQNEQLRAYILNEENDIHVGYALRNWLKQSRNNNWEYIPRGLTFDLNDEIHATYLNMLYPGIIHKLSEIKLRNPSQILVLDAV